MSDDTIFWPVRLPSGAIRRVRVPRKMAEIANQLVKENPNMDRVDALHEAKLMLESQQKEADSQE